MPMDGRVFVHFLRHAHKILEPPPEAQEKLLPAPDTTVAKLLAFRFPVTYSTEMVLDAREFIHEDQPTITDPGIICRIPSPPHNLLQAIAKLLLSNCESGKNMSIVCPHIQRSSEHRLPPWVVTYWFEVEEIRTKYYDPWQKAIKAAKQRQQTLQAKASAAAGASQAKEELFQDIEKLIREIKFQEKLRGFERDTESVGTLTTYMTNDWFSTAHENQMLEVLRREVHADNVLRERVEIVDVHIFSMIKCLYTKRKTDAYWTTRYAKPIRKLGEALASGKKDIMGGIINIDNLHWASVFIDFRKKIILYGDSQGNPAPTSFIRSMDWWTTLHTSDGFRYDALEITYQTDGHSCGILAYNALAHAINPRENPLVEMDNVADKRLEMMSKISRIHLLNVSKMLIITEQRTHCASEPFRFCTPIHQ